ncbi:hypothetical protein B0675_18860 [Streptomyces sp. M41(2017)]|uniref:hypothetical protein n=1 Tax=Streptomyces sp. M41(2017) TaxID=1955065 RepID=UPI0009C14D2F|nr:hypothetical protein [Streptomyces sp. M41(2017)]OQQ18921.1 hypothetical protein B0675_18860 [Streptomyces sp. M41(2017)]
MMPTTTSGMAQGTIARARASQRSLRSWLSSSASPSARRNCGTVTPTAHTRPMRNDSQNRVSWSRSWKFSVPTHRVGAVRPDWESVNASPIPYSSGPTLSTRMGMSAGSTRNQAP